MSKKLIAVASAAALALTALVGVAPASATPVIGYTAVSGTGSLGDPYVSAVPSANTLVAANTLKIAISAIGVGDTATVSISGTAKVVTDEIGTASTLVNVTTLGAASATDKLTSGTTTNFYVYQTSIAAASVITISVSKTASGTTSTTTQTKYFKPSIGPVHNVTNIVAPATIASGATGEVTFVTTDVFGNPISATASIASALLSSTGSVPDASGVATYDATRKLFVAKTVSSTNGPLVLTINAAGQNLTNVGLGASNLFTNNIVVNSPAVASQNAALTAQVATLTAQVAALTAQLANSRGKDVSVTKKKYNNLAKRFNSAFPGQKVALKK